MKAKSVHLFYKTNHLALTTTLLTVRSHREALPAGMVPRPGGRKAPHGVRVGADARDVEGHGRAPRRRDRAPHRRLQLQLPVRPGPDELRQGEAVGLAGIRKPLA